MATFKYSQPYIHPKSYKDKQAKQVDKWFIRYKITFEDSETEYRKEYGKSYKQAQPINYPPNHKNKVANAELLLDLITYDLENGIDPRNREVEKLEKKKMEIKEAEKYKVRYIFDLWFAANNYVNPIPSKEISATKYKGFWLNQFIPHLETIGKAGDIRQVTDEDINHWIKLNYDAGKWSAYTVGIKIGLLTGVFKYAYKQKFMKQNPMVYIDRIKENKVVVKNGESTIKQAKEARFNILTAKELELLYQYFDLKNESIAKTLSYAFIRFSEIFRLQLKHLNTNKWQFEIPATIAKGQRDGRTAIVKIYPPLQEVLIRYLGEYFGDDRKPDYYLFHQFLKTKPSTYSIFQHYFIETKRRIKVEMDIDITKSPYCFKHTGAKSFIDQNKAKSKSSYQIIEAIKMMMRHKDFNTSQKYIYADLGMNLDEESDFTFD